MNLVPNRRRFQRIPCALPIELRCYGKPYPIRSKTTVLSAGGCHVTLSPVIPAGTPADVVFWTAETKLVIQATVRSADNMGNGIEFTGMTEEQRTQLGRYLQRIIL